MDSSKHGTLQEGRDDERSVEALVTQLLRAIYQGSETVWQRNVPTEGTRQSPKYEEEHP